MRLNTRASTEVLAVLAKVVKTLIDEISLPLSTQKVLLDKELPSGKPKPSLAQNVQDDLKNARERVSELQGNHLDHLNRGLEALKTLTQTRDTAEKKTAESIEQIKLIDTKIQQQLAIVQTALGAPEKKTKELEELIANTSGFIADITEELDSLQPQSENISVPKDLRAQLIEAIKPVRLNLDELSDALKILAQNQRETEAAIIIQNMFRKRQERLWQERALKDKGIADLADSKTKEQVTIIKQKIDAIADEVAQTLEAITATLEPENADSADKLDALVEEINTFIKEKDIVLGVHLEELQLPAIPSLSIDTKDLLDQTIIKAEDLRKVQLPNLGKRLIKVQELSATRRKEEKAAEEVAAKGLLVVEELMLNLQNTKKEVEKAQGDIKLKAAALTELADNTEQLIAQARLTLSEQQEALGAEKQKIFDTTIKEKIDHVLEIADEEEELLQDIEDATKQLRELADIREKEDKQVKPLEKKPETKQKPPEKKLNPTFELAIRKDTAGKWSLESNNPTGTPSWTKCRELPNMPEDTTSEDLFEALKNLKLKPTDLSDGLVSIESKLTAVPPIIIIHIRATNTKDALEIAAGLVEKASNALKAKEEEKNTPTKV
ncbi:hypothetical protein GAMM_40306 [Gammaproteobacteria bacterium]